MARLDFSGQLQGLFYVFLLAAFATSHQAEGTAESKAAGPGSCSGGCQAR